MFLTPLAANRGLAAQFILSLLRRIGFNKAIQPKRMIYHPTKSAKISLDLIDYPDLSLLLRLVNDLKHTKCLALLRAECQLAILQASLALTRQADRLRRLIQKAVPTMTFRPLHDRILVRPLKADEKTKGGIIIPDTVQEKPMEGEVVATGPGARDGRGEVIMLDVKTGDHVLFAKWSGTEIRIEGEDLLVLKEADLMGVVEHPSALMSQAG
jgi:chaperonin GroES